MSLFLPFLGPSLIVFGAILGIGMLYLVSWAGRGRSKAPEPMPEPEPEPEPVILTCLHGHPITPENTYVYPSGRRICRPCARERQKRKRDKGESNA